MFIGMCLFVSCTSAQTFVADSTLLDGSWTPMQQEIGGKALPAAAFEKEKLVISDSSYTFSAESVDKGTLYYKNGQMDIYGKDGINNGKHFTAIYKLDSNHLKICYNLSGNSYPATFTTIQKPTLFLSVFTKDK